MISAFQKFTSWINSKLGTAVDYDGVYGAQCVDFARAYAESAWNPIKSFGWSAYNGWVTWSPFVKTKWKRIERNGKNIPLAWDIIFFAPTPKNQYGHVAVVDSGCTATTLKIIEQNAWTGNGSGKWANAVKKSTLGYDVRGKCVGWYTLL